MNKINLAVVGSGGFAQVHLTALRNLISYYPLNADIKLKYIASPSQENREKIKEKFSIETALHPDELWKKSDIDAVIIASSNESHFSCLEKAVEKKIKRIYIEKPICCSEEELKKIENTILPKSESYIQTGFQFIQMPSFRQAYSLMKDGSLGKIIHFSGRYLHGDYLDPAYRIKRKWRLKPAPEGGALTDLGSHVLSIMSAFFDPLSLELKSALTSGKFDDTDPKSDLCTTLLFNSSKNSIHGTVCASRVSIGSGDLLEFEVWGEKGAIKISTSEFDTLKFYDGKQWVSRFLGNNYSPISQFPSPHTPSGWLRSLMHSQYIFLGGEDKNTFIPNLSHGVQVQRIVNQAAKMLYQ